MPLSEKRSHFIRLQVGYGKAYVIGLQIRVFPDQTCCIWQTAKTISSKTKFTWRQFTFPTLIFLPSGPRGVFRGPYHPTCRVINFWLPTVLKNWRICMFYPRFACFSSIQIDLSSFHDNLACNHRFSIDNRHVSRIIWVLLCNINTPLRLAMVRLVLFSFWDWGYKPPGCQ